MSYLMSPARDLVVNIQGMLTPAEWLGIARGSEDGLLPRCCAEISNLREELTHISMIDPDALWPSSAWIEVADQQHDLTGKILGVVQAVSEAVYQTNRSWRQDLAEYQKGREAKRLQAAALAMALNDKFDGNMCAFAVDGEVHFWEPEHVLALIRDRATCSSVVNRYSELIAEISE